MNPLDYINGVWAARYFWWHLAMSDLRARWRRSFFGVFWSILQPLGLTLLISLVFSNIFGSSLGAYAPYILSGMLVWDYVISTVVGGALAFVQADAYIKQTRHPLAIYTLRNVVAGLFIFALAGTALIVWVLAAFPQNLSWSWLAALTIFPILAMIAWPWATLMAYIGTRFRDLPHALGLAMQAMWFVSPIYFEESVFRRGDLHILLDYNPIYHLLEIVRAPLLRGEWPTLLNYGWCIATALVIAALAIIIGRRAEKKVIFYL
ncbi:ABC transporter permease [Chelativorans sp. AA-79]|uniref:ABC transporter permease n=1 Tax=Chelativorans sp. AA-79 TaxID=3028735 RepID=UPI0023F84A99|nr:ABC transporter permease [Chelativorans sp. AA-79]WEX08339.1 ABC transporter permease [Chelativorans sp. AA-79]